MPGGVGGQRREPLPTRLARDIKNGFLTSERLNRIFPELMQRSKFNISMNSKQLFNRYAVKINMLFVFLQ